MRATDLTGRTFGRLRVLARAESVMIRGEKTAIWLCVCNCGAERRVIARYLVSGDTASCGCAKSVGSTTHGLSGTPEYICWRLMRQRCGNPKDPRFEDYGGRGITVCDRWQSFENFIADMGNRPGPDYSIERMHNDRGYEPSNCKWATRSEQQHNKGLSRNSSTGVKGVYMGRNGKWRANIADGGKTYHLGTYDSIEAAAVARKEGERTYWGRP